MEIGTEYKLEITVKESETAEMIGSGGLPVYATPSMICHMELAAFRLAEKYGYQTVGTKVNIDHLRACRPGTEITVTAVINEIDGRRLEYSVMVEDDLGIIGEGKHQRYIIDPQRFMSKLG